MNNPRREPDDEKDQSPIVGGTSLPFLPSFPFPSLSPFPSLPFLSSSLPPLPPFRLYFTEIFGEILKVVSSKKRKRKRKRKGEKSAAAGKVQSEKNTYGGAAGNHGKRS